MTMAMPTASKPKKKKYNGPESDFYDRLKGKSVIIALRDDEKIRRQLKWVDRYSVGVLNDDGAEQLICKHAIATIELALGQDNDEGAAASRGLQQLETED